jgi:type III secretion system low calcium response chaperone LcrH/SycD
MSATIPATPELPEISDEELTKTTLDFLAKGRTIRELRGLTREHLDAIYYVAYQKYAGGNYEQADQLFRCLCFFDHLEKKYWLGLGGCRQLQHRYPEAIEAYTFAMLLDSDDPHPPLHAADCHLALGNREAAISGLTAALEWSGDRPEYRSVRTRAANLLDVLNAQPGARTEG